MTDIYVSGAQRVNSLMMMFIVWFLYAYMFVKLDINLQEKKVL
jgi:hypothetical protein